MAKNRKHQTAAIRFGPALKVVLLGSLICGSAVGYVWQKSEINRLGQQVGQRETRLRQLRDDNQRLTDQIAILHSPVMLDRRVRELQLGLAPAQPLQKVRLEEPAPVAPAKNLARQFTQRSMTGMTP